MIRKRIVRQKKGLFINEVEGLLDSWIWLLLYLEKLKKKLKKNSFFSFSGKFRKNWKCFFTIFCQNFEKFRFFLASEKIESFKKWKIIWLNERSWFSGYENDIENWCENWLKGYFEIFEKRKIEKYYGNFWKVEKWLRFFGKSKKI